MRANCIICTDIFDEINPISAAKCGHVYHSSCLTMWVGQSKTCPHCRSRLTLNDIYKLYFNFPPRSDLNSSELENEVLNLKSQVSAKNVELVACKKEKDAIAKYVREAEKNASDLQQAVYKYQSDIAELRLITKSVAQKDAKILKLEQMNVALTNDLQHLNNVKTIVNGTQKDVENIMNEYNNSSEALKQLACYCTCLKRELQKVMESKNKLLELNSKLKRDNGVFAAKISRYEDAMATSKSISKSLTPAKKSPLLCTNDNNLLNVNTLASTSRNSFSEEVTISPLSVPFNKTKFNMCIKTSSGSVYKSDLKSQNNVEQINIASQLGKIQNDESSIIRTGYNGLGGHTNFVNCTNRNKIKNLKRKH